MPRGYTIVTGCRGWKTQCMKALRIWFCIDNLPPALLPRLWRYTRRHDESRNYAVAMDVRGEHFRGWRRPSIGWITRAMSIA